MLVLKNKFWFWFHVAGACLSCVTASYVDAPLGWAVAAILFGGHALNNVDVDKLDLI